MYRIILILLLSVTAGLVRADFGNEAARVENLLRQGLYRLALESAENAKTETPVQKARKDGLLGLTHYEMHHYQPAEAHLSAAVESGAGSPGERSRWLGALADLRGNRGDVAEARRLYEQALRLAAEDRSLVAGLRLGRVMQMEGEERLAELREIRAGLDRIEGGTARARLLVNLGTRARDAGAAGEALAESAFATAHALPGVEPRVRVEALDGLAQWYEEQEQLQTALRHNSEAIALAQSLAARDLLLDLEWRQGRIHKSLNHPAEALLAYRQAVGHLEAVRDDIPVEYHDGRSSFRETLEPLYLGLADLLLRQAAEAEGTARTDLLRQARGAVELIKQSELEDFLGGRCAVEGVKTARLEAVESRTAILYPVILADRLELLVSSGEEIRQFRQEVSPTALQRTARHYAQALLHGQVEVNEMGQQLHRWLIDPIEAWLRERRIETLVIVPDGVLRLIPLAALHDGNRYLIERYAVATSPGLTLFEPTPLQNHGMQTLLAGMSEPGAVVDHLPPAFSTAMRTAIERGRGRGREMAFASRALPVSPDDVPPSSIPLPAPNRELRELMKDQLRLPGVAEEISHLQQKLPNTLLMNESFTVAGFQREIVRRPYSVVHIASHGVFSKTADTSFIMAHDDLISINQLEQMLKSDQFRKQPVELMTLSACQTAEGDDRAPLGLSGVALKAKVRSALGSLWPVADEAASRLMVEFYQALNQPGVGKAQALRQAQLSLMRDPKMIHPFFWSPFILVGNWL